MCVCVCHRDACEQGVGASGPSGGSATCTGGGVQESCPHSTRQLQSSYGTVLVHTQMDTQMHAHTTQAPPDVDVQNRILWGFEL